MLLLRHCQTLKGIKLYCGNLKCLPLYAHTKKAKKEGGVVDEKTIYKISFISTFEKSFGRGFHMIKAKDNLITAFFVPKLVKGKSGNEHVT